MIDEVVFVGNMEDFAEVIERIKPNSHIIWDERLELVREVREGKSKLALEITRKWDKVG